MRMCIDLRDLATTAFIRVIAAVQMRTDFRDKVTLEKVRLHFVTFWLNGHRQARQDLKFKWRSVSIIAFVWSAGLVSRFSVLTLISVIPFYGVSGTGREACHPDGSFRLDSQTFKYWRAGFFEITLAFGELGFTAVKAIDIIWNMVISRGGQALLALVSWRVFAMYVTASMELSPITFSTYRAIFLQSEPSIAGIPRTIRDFCFRLRLHSRLAMVLIITTMILILAFPTLSSAMSGYSGTVDSFVPDKDGNLVPFDKFNLVSYIIQDGWRVNLTSNYLVTAENLDPMLVSTNSWWFVTEMEEVVSNYVGKYNLPSVKNISSQFMNFTLDPPILDISSARASRYLNLSRPTRPVIQTNQSLDIPGPMWEYKNQTYNLDYIKSNGTCQTLESYQWGFAFIQLYLMVVLLLLWTTGMIVMYVWSVQTLKKQGRKEVAGEQKAVFELSEAMRTQLDSLGEDVSQDISALAESSLRRRITIDLHGGSISYTARVRPMEPQPEPTRTPLWWRWIKEVRWWLVGWGAAFLCLFKAALFFNFSFPGAFVFTLFMGQRIAAEECSSFGQRSCSVLYLVPYSEHREISCKNKNV